MTVQIGLLLALGCAFATNLAFLWKHRGAVAAPEVNIRHPLASAKGLFASKWWTIGFAVALVAWVLHVAALALAPISLVQAVISGGLVFLAVLADRWFGFELGKREWMGVALTAVGLAFLGLTVQTGAEGSHSSYSISGMIAFEGAMVFLGRRPADLAPRRAASATAAACMLGAAAGILFGVSDISIKALTGTVPGDADVDRQPLDAGRRRRLDRRLLRLRPRPAGRRGRLGDRAHLGVRQPVARSSAASSCSATRWAATRSRSSPAAWPSRW